MIFLSQHRDVVANRIAEDLADFRHKRSLGLGSMFGEQKLSGRQYPCDLGKDDCMSEASRSEFSLR